VDQLLVDRRDHSVSDLNPSFTVTTGASVGIRGPTRQFLSVPLQQFRPPQTLPLPRERLAKPRISPYLNPGERTELSSRVEGTRKVGGNDPIGLQVDKQTCGPLSLASTLVIEFDIGLPLESALGIPGRASVAP
jgi:hypothetical protein